MFLIVRSKATRHDKQAKQFNTLGLSIKDVRRDRGRGRSNADTCGQRGRGVKALADVRKPVLFLIIPACFADTLHGLYQV